MSDDYCYKCKCEVPVGHHQCSECVIETLRKRQKEDEEAFWEERDARVELQAKVERLESYLDALSNGFDRPWREDFKEWEGENT